MPGMDRYQLEAMKQQGLQSLIQRARQARKDDLAEKLAQYDMAYKEQQRVNLANRDARDTEKHGLDMETGWQDFEITGKKEERDVDDFNWNKENVRPRTLARMDTDIEGKRVDIANTRDIMNRRQREPIGGGGQGGGTGGGKPVTRRDFEAALKIVNETSSRTKEGKTQDMDTHLYDSAMETVTTYREQVLPQQYPPAKYAERTITDPVTKFRYRSDGTQWRRIIQTGN